MKYRPSCPNRFGMPRPFFRMVEGRGSVVLARSGTWNRRPMPRWFVELACARNAETFMEDEHPAHRLPRNYDFLYGTVHTQYRDPHGRLTR